MATSAIEKRTVSAKGRGRNGASRRTIKTYSIQLPLKLADKLEALFATHKKNARTKVLRDVLTLGLHEIEKASATAIGVQGFQPDTQQPVYLLTGPFSEFHNVIHKDRNARDREIFEDGPQPTGFKDDYCLGYPE
jgi:predicted DNA-binding protein